MYSSKCTRYRQPKVAVICAKEKVNPKMQDTVDAKDLEDMCKKVK